MKRKKSDNADDKTHLLFWFLSSYCFSFISSGCCISVWLRICSDVSHTTSTWSCSNAVGASLSWITFPLHTPGSTSNNRTTPKCTARVTSSVRWGGSCVPSCSRPWHARRSLLLLFIASFHNLHPSEKYKLRLLTIPKDYQTPTWDFQYFFTLRIRDMNEVPSRDNAPSADSLRVNSIYADLQKANNFGHLKASGN